MIDTMTSEDIIVAELSLKRIEHDFAKLKRELNEVMALLTARERRLIQARLRANRRWMAERFDGPKH